MSSPAMITNVPVDLFTKPVEDEQRRIQHQLDSNKRERSALKAVVNQMLTAVITSNPDVNMVSDVPATTSSSSCSYKTIKSVESVTHISSVGNDTDFSSTVVPLASSVDLPTMAGTYVPPSEKDLLDTFLDMSSKGELDLSDEFKKECYCVKTRIDALDEISAGLQERWFEIETTISKIKNDIVSIKQYQRIDNLLLHNFRLPASKMTSLQFCMYVAKQLNLLLPQLPLPIHWQHISTAHVLPTIAKKSTVVVVRFCNRNIKDMIYAHKDLIGNGILVTEHLLDYNKSVYDKARALFSFATVRTESCKVFVDIDGKSIQVTSVDEVEKLFAQFCEFIGSNDSYCFPIIKNSSHRAPFYRNASNVHFSKNLSPRPKVNRFKRKHSTGYSVYNRNY